MADPPDTDELARRFVTLWQEQMLAVAADPAVAETAARWLTLFAAPPFAGVPFAGFGTPSPAPHHDAATPPGPPPAAGAHDAGRHDLEQLARRMAALEERIAGLEAAQRGPARRPRRAAPRRRP
ncbi:hypothetical protein STAQ_44400 [Allostella sp. ATCC 35155]|nr:hypothetical protein STAQ_44400 [Stella sp. ATCC 35155]